MARIIDILHISLTHIHLGHSQLITAKQSILVKASLKKNIMKKNITANMIMIMKKIFIRKKIKRKNRLIMMMSSCLSWICLKNWSIILTCFMCASLLMYMSAACVRQLLHWIISYINTFNLFMTISKPRQRPRNPVQPSQALILSLRLTQWKQIKQRHMLLTSLNQTSLTESTNLDADFGADTIWWYSFTSVLKAPSKWPALTWDVLCHWLIEVFSVNTYLISVFNKLRSR